MLSVSFLRVFKIRQISVKLAELITILFNYGMNSKDVTMVGHSLGAHIGGLSAKQVESGNKIAVIIGLGECIQDKRTNR